jgi:hypothetical protein
MKINRAAALASSAEQAESQSPMMAAFAQNLLLAPNPVGHPRQACVQNC